MLQVTICKRWLLRYNHSEWNNFGVGYCRCQCSWDGTWWPGHVGQPRCDYYLGWSQIRSLFCYRTRSCSSCQVVRVPTYRKKPPNVASLWCTQPASSLRRSQGGQEYVGPILLPIATHTYVLRVSDSWAMRTRVLVGKSLSFHTGNDGIMWFHVHGRHQAVAPIAACRKEFSIFNSFVVFFTQLSCPRMKGAITLSRYNYI